MSRALARHGLDFSQTRRRDCPDNQKDGSVNKRMLLLAALAGLLAALGGQGPVWP
jgi:hypothetical protein